VAAECIYVAKKSSVAVVMHVLLCCKLLQNETVMDGKFMK